MGGVGVRSVTEMSVHSVFFPLNVKLEKLMVTIVLEVVETESADFKSLCEVCTF